ncbi:hypothetical protein B9Z55_005037 [Caenorhabditis nigoni]|uniref:Uncharacterized protein n=1 Tax=Caenorhabditis nigoni TaxID=1611254 RepID=A0A2G5UZ45_9PELO|nr:hypothetical protein B9Z55_005037 [Caenorhabditis nigoni]
MEKLASFYTTSKAYIDPLRIQIDEKVSGGLNNAAGWFKETASPAIRDKFNEYKEKLQDPETHKNIREWVAEKYEAASEFTKEEIVPELKKVYEAATADVTTSEPKKDDDE